MAQDSPKLSKGKHLFAEATKYHKTVSVSFLVQLYLSAVSSVKFLGGKKKAGPLYSDVLTHTRVM